MGLFPQRDWDNPYSENTSVPTDTIMQTVTQMPCDRSQAKSQGKERSFHMNDTPNDFPQQESRHLNVNLWQMKDVKTPSEKQLSLRARP